VDDQDREMNIDSIANHLWSCARAQRMSSNSTGTTNPDEGFTASVVRPSTVHPFGGHKTSIPACTANTGA